MTKIPDDNDAPNPILEYPGDSLPSFFSTILGELPTFAFPDWGPPPPLPQGQSRPSPPPDPGPPGIEVDPPARHLHGCSVRRVSFGPRHLTLPLRDCLA